MTETTYEFTRSRRTGAPVTGQFLAPLIWGAVRALTSLFAAGPARASQGRQASAEAAAVRRMAQRYSQTDRGFAADLLAAADRHESAARERRPGSAADRRA